PSLPNKTVDMYWVPRFRGARRVWGGDTSRHRRFGGARGRLKAEKYPNLAKWLENACPSVYKRHHKSGTEIGSACQPDIARVPAPARKEPMDREQPKSGATHQARAPAGSLLGQSKNRLPKFRSLS